MIVTWYAFQTHLDENRTRHDGTTVKSRAVVFCRYRFSFGPVEKCQHRPALPCSVNRNGSVFVEPKAACVDGCRVTIFEPSMFVVRCVDGVLTQPRPVRKTLSLREPGLALVRFGRPQRVHYWCAPSVESVACRPRSPWRPTVHDDGRAEMRLRWSHLLDALVLSSSRRSMLRVPSRDWSRFSFRIRPPVVARPHRTPTWSSRGIR
jgi:hypothetical protein